jgi:hypothetical protein
MRGTCTGIERIPSPIAARAFPLNVLRHWGGSVPTGESLIDRRLESHMAARIHGCFQFHNTWKQPRGLSSFYSRRRLPVNLAPNHPSATPTKRCDIYKIEIPRIAKLKHTRKRPVQEDTTPQKNTEHTTAPGHIIPPPQDDRRAEYSSPLFAPTRVRNALIFQIINRRGSFVADLSAH